MNSAARLEISWSVENCGTYLSILMYIPCRTIETKEQFELMFCFCEIHACHVQVSWHAEQL
jgi:hypothetical protein